MSRLNFKETSIRNSWEDFDESDVEYHIKSSSKNSTPIVSSNDMKNDKNPPMSESKMSEWLSRFLKKKKVDDITTVPVISSLNDTFVRDFHEQFKNGNKNAEKESDEDDLESTKIPSVLNQTNEENKNDESDNNSVKVSPKLASITMFNLPYSITTQEVQSFGEKYGFTFSTVTIVMGQEKKLTCWHCSV